jgi:multiple sugar transport system permease protein
MTMPAIFYNLVMGTIGAFQIFGLPFNLVGEAGGASNSLYFVVMHIYRKAFNELAFSFAASMSWVLFMFIGVLTLLNFSIQKWIHYGDDE